jgi:hypothetical protein
MHSIMETASTLRALQAMWPEIPVLSDWERDLGEAAFDHHMVT